MVLGPSHGGWGRDVNPDAFREANAGPRVVLRIANKIDVIFSQRGTGKERDFFKSAGESRQLPFGYSILCGHHVEIDVPLSLSPWIGLVSLTLALAFRGP
jgi:hypothetical protein